MAKARRNDIGKVKLLGVVRRKRPALMMSTALQATVILVLSLPANAQPAPNARPVVGSVVAGSAVVSHTSNNTRIDQSSQRAAIDWNSFNVGSQQSVTFQQPSVSSVTLNRVTGPDPSQIAGRIDANGQVVLVNQSGVTFYKGAQVNTAGLIVTTANVTNQNFMAGNMKFDQAGNPNARIENQGSITIKEAGLAALVAPQVANSGVISAKLGHVVLAGAKTATLDLYGDGLLALDVSNQVTHTRIGPDGKAATALVTNSGVIIADGGTVQLTARAADGIVQNLVQAGGEIRAATMGDHTGTVALNGVGGSIVVEGQLSAPGYAPGTKGGNIEVTGSGNVIVASTAKISASGKAGGGNVGIGTTLDRVKGGPSVTPRSVAANAVIHKGATITADAIENGHGGRVTVFSSLSNGTTVTDGTITAMGGPAGGNGGFVEVSGGLLSLAGHVDASAPLGATGTLLLDPSDLWISDTQPAVATFAVTAGNLPTIAANQAPDAATVSWVSPALLAAQNADISLASTNNMFVASSNGTANSLNLGTHTLTLTGGTGLTIDRGFTITAGGMSFTTLSGAITLNGSSGVTGGLITAPQLAALTPTSLQASTATTTVTLNSAGGIALADAVIGSVATPVNIFDLSSSSGGVTQSVSGVIHANTLQSSGGAAGTVSLLGANQVVSTGKFTTIGDFKLTNTSALTVGDTISASGSIYLETSNVLGITIGAGGAVAAGSGNHASFQANVLNINVGGTITGGTFEFGLDTPGALSLGAGGNLPTLVGVGTTTAEIGNVTVPGSGSTPTATSITTVATFDGNKLPVALNTSGAITEGPGDAIINVATLSGTAASVNLNAANAIANIGSFTATSGTFLMTDGGLAGTLTVSGPLTSITNDVTLSGSPALNVTGSIGAAGTVSLNSVEIDLASAAIVTGPTVKLNAGATGITFAGNASIGQSGGTVDINSAGTISEPASSVINAGTVVSTSGISGDVKLFGTANAIDNLGSIALSSGVNFGLKDASALHVIGTVAVSGASTQLYLQSSNSGGITIKAGGALQADSGSGLVSLQADAFTNNGSVAAATVEIAPNTSGRTMTLGAAGGLSLISQSGFKTGNLVFGAVTVPGAAQTTTTGAIAIAGGGFDTTGVSTVTLDATGAVTQSAALTGHSQLQGKAASFTLLNGGNDFSTIALNATAGDIQVVDSVAVILSGNTASANIYFVAPTETLNGVVTAGGILGLQTDSFSRTSGSLTGTTVELAPLTSISESLGSGSGLVLASSAFITGNLRIGAVTVPGTGLTTTASSIDVGSAFGSSSLALELRGLGGITESGGAITAATITGTAGGTVNLNNANAIAALGSFDAGTNAFTLFDNGLAGNLTVNGPVTGSTIRIAAAPTITVAGTIDATTKAEISSGAGGVTIQAAGNVTAPDVVLDPVAGGISLAGKIGQTNGTVDLSTSGANDVTELAGAVVTAGKLISSSGIGGALDLSAGNNDIANLGSITTVGAISVNDAGHTGTLGVVGPLSATDVTLISGTGALTVTGSIFADFTISLDGTNPTAGISLKDGAILTAPTIDLKGGTIGIALTGTASVGTGTSIVDLTTTGGGVTEDTIAKISGTLQSTGGVVGNVDLFGTNNAIAALGNFAVSGGTNRFVLDDGVALTVSGTVTAPGQVYLQTSAAGGINIAAGGSVGAGGLASFQADAFTNLGAVTGSTFEWAPNTNGATQTLLSANGLPNNVRIGAVTLPGSSSPTITAGSIVIGGNFGTGTTNLELDSQGGISESGVFAITAASLTGKSGATVSLTNANAIASLGSFGVGGGGNFTLNDSGLAGNLTVTGPLNGGTVTIQNAPTITIGGSIDGTTEVVIASGAGGIALTAAGTVDSAGGIVDLSTTGGGITEAAGGLIKAGTLQSTGGVVGTFDLSASNNDIANVGSVIVTGAGAFSLNDGARTGTLGVGGPLTATDVSIVSGTGALTVTGSIGATATISLDGSNPSAGIALNSGAVVTGATIDLKGGTIGIKLNGTASLGKLGAVVDFNTTGGGVIEASTATITAGTLQSTGNVVGNTDLLSALNAIGTLGNFAVTGAGNRFVMDDSVALTVAGVVTAPGQIYLESSNASGISIISGGSVGAGGLASFQADAFTNAGNVSGSTFEWAPNTSGTTQTLLSLSGLPDNVRIGAVTLPGASSPMITAGSIVVGADFGTSSTNLELDTSGGITQTAGSITAASLIGQAGTTVSLTDANAIATLGSFGLAAGNFILNDGGLSSNLTVDGPLNGATVSITNAPTITIDGSIDASSEVLIASGIGGIKLAGGAKVRSPAGIVDFATTGGGVSEVAGALLTAATLQSPGTVVGRFDLSLGTNDIANLGSINVSGGDFVLADGARAGTLGLSGPVTADDVFVVSGAGALIVTGSIGATGTVDLDGSNSAAGIQLNTGAVVTGATIDLNGGDIGIALNGNASLGNTGAIVDITTVGGGVTEASTATVTAGTLQSPGTVVGTFDLSLGANDVANLGTINVKLGDFLLGDSGRVGTLGVSGPVMADNVFIISGAGALTVTGTIGATGTVDLDGSNAAAGVALNTGAVVTGATIDVNGGINRIALNGNALLGNSGAIVDLTTAGGGVTEASTATMIAGTLQSTAGINGDVALPGAANAIANIGSLAVTSGTFSLNDTGDLNILGRLTASSITIGDTGTLTVTDCLVATSAVSLTGGNIAITGLVSDGGSGTTSLIANAGTINETGTLIAGTLSGSATSGGAARTVSLMGATATANQVANLGNFSASTFSLRDGASLNVTGALTASSSATIVDAGALSVSGTIAPPNGTNSIAVGLNAGTIDIPGFASAGSSGTMSLVANAGSIGETGTLIAATLSGSATGSASLAGNSFSNQIGTLGSFSAPQFSLNDGVALNVAGPLKAATSVTIDDASSLLVSGTIAPSSGNTAIAVDLTAATIDIPGVVSDGGAGTTSLIANAGTIGETGTLISGTLSGSATNGGALQSASLTGANQVANLADFSASAFKLNDAVSLNVVGPVTVSSSATIVDAGALSVSGTITPSSGAIAVALTGASIGISGLVSDGGSGTTNLVATGGTISETGQLKSGTLTGSATGAASLTGAGSNQVATLGNFTATDFTLNDTANLSVMGTVNSAQSATITDTGSLLISGTIAPPNGTNNIAVGLTAGTINISGLVSDGGAGATSLIANAGTIGETGTLIAGTLTGSATTGGALQAVSLMGANAVSNQIGILGSFSASSFTLRDGANLTVAGVLTAGSSVSILDSGALLVSGTIAPPSGTNAITVGLTAANVGITGLVSDGGSGTTSLVANASTINETGTLIAGTLSGSATSSANLAGTSLSNHIGTVSSFTASGLTLNDGASLTISGPVNGGASVTVFDNGTLTIGGGGSVAGKAVALTASDLAIFGNVTDGGSGTVNLIANSGTIDDTGILTSGTLTGSAVGSAVFSNTANQIITMGNFASNGLTLADGSSLTINGIINGGTSATITETGALTISPGASLGAGVVNMTTGGNVIIGGTLNGTSSATINDAGAFTVNAGGAVKAGILSLSVGKDIVVGGVVDGGSSATVTGGGALLVGSGGTLIADTISVTTNNDLTIQGLVQDANSVNLVTKSGAIQEDGGTLIADLLNGSAFSNASLTGNGNNRIAQLGSFTSGGTLALNDSTDLTIKGPLTAPSIVIDAGNNAITLANNAVITTGGVARPAGTVTDFPPDAITTSGAFLTTGKGFAQQGSSTIQGFNGGPSVLRINATGAADIAFDPTGGLVGTNTWLILAIGSGNATGQVNVQSLDVIRSGTSGSTSLNGSVGGLTGSAAAGTAGIQPSPNSNFRFNSCPIHSVNCVLLPTQGLPVASPLNDIYFGTLFNPNDEDDLLLPIVSDRDY